jgi:hypothetical protein
LVEDREHTIAGASERIAGMATDGGVKDPVMQIHRAQHVVGVATKQRGRAHYIGRQNCPLANVGRQFRQVRAEVGAVHRQMFSHSVGHA